MESTFFRVLFVITAVQAVTEGIITKVNNKEIPLRGNKRRQNIFRTIIKINKFRLKDPLLNRKDLFQSDIMVTQELRTAITASHGEFINVRSTLNNSLNRAAIGSQSGLWIGTNGQPEIPYVIEPSNLHATSVISKAMQHWSAHVPCLKFVKRTNQQHFLSFYAGNGCSSFVGRTGGKQPISIGVGCETIGVVIHEIGHALGFWHEHSRPDRDQYVTIHWNNIKAGGEDNFKKITGSTINSLDVNYDTESIMHYPSWAFQAATGLHTIVKKDGSIIRGNRQSLSALDVQQAKRLYCRLPTTSPPTTTPTACQHIDNHEMCPVWKQQGFCNSSSQYLNFMLQNCQKSCLCKKVGCTDKNNACAQWAASGYCTNISYKDYMAAICTKSCHNCK